MGADGVQWLETRRFGLRPHCVGVAVEDVRLALDFDAQEGMADVSGPDP